LLQIEDFEAVGLPRVLAALGDYKLMSKQVPTLGQALLTGTIMIFCCF